MTTINDFKILPLHFTSDNKNYHQLFIKEHNVRKYDESKPPNKTLFITNIPPYATVSGLKQIFSVCGRIKSVLIENNSQLGLKCGFKSGYVIFKKCESLKNALNLIKLNPLSTSFKQTSTVGLTKWITDYNKSILDNSKLDKEIKSFIQKYDEEQQKNEKEISNIDDDGWTIVTKKNRKPGIERKESITNKIIAKNKLKSKKKYLKNFYTFQIKEEKMKNIIALRKSFEESKEKVNVMKKLRNFKPFK